MTSDESLAGKLDIKNPKGEPIKVVYSDKNELTIEVPIIDDDDWNADLDFHIELFNYDKFANYSQYEQLAGDDTKCTITIIDEDCPGTLGFEATDVQVSSEDKHAIVKVIRTDGTDGRVSCEVRTQEYTAKEIANFQPLEHGYRVVFENGETEKEVEITLGAFNNGEENEGGDESGSDSGESIFKVFLENQDPKGTREKPGVKISHKNCCTVTIRSGEVDAAYKEENHKLLEYYLNRKDRTYGQ